MQENQYNTTKEEDNTSTQTVSSEKLNLPQIVEELFMVLTGKEREVITKRFSLNNKPRQTLEKIGQHFSVTRERIRQIEKIALNKLKRTVNNTKLKNINEISLEILDKFGGVLKETKLISEIINAMYLLESPIDPHIVRLSLNINNNITKSEKSNLTEAFWRLNHIELKLVKETIDRSLKFLSKAKDVIEPEKISAEIKKQMDGKDITITPILISSILDVDNRIKKTENGFGLMSWRHINPKSIRDKAYIILKKNKKPLHFVSIANQIINAGFDKKVVTTQAVHNELIRDEQFVLVGRGLYALKEWGYKKGTVADVIQNLLKKKSPLTKQEIIHGVLKQRQVKKGTISLNLQKNSQFVRVGRAVYNLDESKV